MFEISGIINGGYTEFFKNPTLEEIKILNDITRGFIDEFGNLYVWRHSVVHIDALIFLNSNGIIKFKYDEFSHILKEGFCVETEKVNVYLGESIVTGLSEEHIELIKEYMKLCKKKNEKFNFYMNKKGIG